MSAPITRPALAVTVASNASYAAPRVAAQPGVVQRAAELFAAIVSYPRRQAVRQELTRLNDRDLADIGLLRSDVARVFDRAFLAERNLSRRGF